MRKIFNILFVLIISFNATGQNDPAAISILDRFSSAAMAAPSVHMKFIMITTDQVEQTKDTIPGSVILSRDNYRLDLPDNIIWYNGETNWSLLPAEKEVTITKPDRKDDSFETRPSSVFTMYKKGYKCRLVEERKDSYIIDLYPDEIKNELIRVRLIIKKSNLDPVSFEYKRRDGLILTLVVKDYDLKQNIQSGMFRFPAEDYKGVEVIDMR
ncbi:MAG TPA: outer membrane lipoprotein carrier protein LolA [Bacteroidales bacterium]|nr:outer membrane lipoprotein carrier protein LolA [Bacteroidales bacterium]HPM86934.1 outer membrane lipoprotein carrier protein LolA [Bacteroidales bacterium]